MIATHFLKNILVNLLFKFYLNDLLIRGYWFPFSLFMREAENVENVDSIFVHSVQLLNRTQSFNDFQM